MSRIFFASLLLAGACSTSFAAVDSGLLALAPANSQIIAGIDFEGSRSSAFGQFLLRQMSTHDNDLQQLIEQTGFDPRRDLQFLLFTATPSPNSRSQGSFAVLARGSFDQNRIKAAAQKGGSTIQQFQGVDLVVKTNGNGPFAFAFPDVDLAIAGDLATVRQVIANRSQPTELDPILQDQVLQVEANSAWFASLASASSLAARVSPPADSATGRAQVLQSVTRSNGGIDLLSNSDVVFNAETRSAQDATALADMIRFLSSMAQMQNSNTGQPAPLATALEGMKLDVAGSAVHMSMHLPEAVLEQFIATQRQRPTHNAAH
jgi:hypothetical protein